MIELLVKYEISFDQLALIGLTITFSILAMSKRKQPYHTYCLFMGKGSLSLGFWKRKQIGFKPLHTFPFHADIFYNSTEYFFSR